MKETCAKRVPMLCCHNVRERSVDCPSVSRVSGDPEKSQSCGYNKDLVEDYVQSLQTMLCTTLSKRYLSNARF